MCSNYELWKWQSNMCPADYQLLKSELVIPLHFQAFIYYGSTAQVLKVCIGHLVLQPV